MTSGKLILNRVFACFNDGRLQDVEQYFTADVNFKDSAGQTGSSPKEIRQWLEGWKSAFPNARLTMVNAVDTGDRCACQTRAVGTHDGPLQTPDGFVPPTGKRVVMDTCDFARVRDGKICEWSAYYNPMEMMVQLGMMPTPGAPSPRAIYQKLVDAFNGGNFDTFADCLAPDCRMNETGGVSVTGSAAVTDIYRGWKEAFPDATIALDHIAQDNDCCAGFGTAKGTHQGPMHSPDGVVHATGRTLAVAVQDFVRVQNGKIVEWDSFYDQAAMLAQLGLFPGSGPEARNTDAVKRGYEAFTRGDISAVMSMLTEDVDWSVEAAPGSKVPWHMSVHRREDVPKFFTALAGAIDTTKFEVAELVATGNTVAARIVFEGTVRKNGRKTSGESCQWFTFNDDGKIVRWHSYENTAADVEAWFSLAPSDYSAQAPH